MCTALVRLSSMGSSGGYFFLVQILDGFATTDDNVTGKLPSYISDAGFSGVEETHRETTLLGTISLYRAVAS